jgi:hypothetical protein
MNFLKGFVATLAGTGVLMSLDIMIKNPNEGWHSILPKVTFLFGIWVIANIKYD